jgi:hypothetical protein
MRYRNNPIYVSPPKEVKACKSGKIASQYRQNFREKNSAMQMVTFESTVKQMQDDRISWQAAV